MTAGLSPTANIKDAEVNRQFPFSTDLNEMLPDLLKLRMKAEKPEIKVTQYLHYR